MTLMADPYSPPPSFHTGAAHPMLDALLVAALCASTSLALPLAPPPDVAAHLSPRSNLTARAGEYTAIDSGDLVAQGYGNWRLASQRLLGKCFAAPQTLSEPGADPVLLPRPQPSALTSIRRSTSAS